MIEIHIVNDETPIEDIEDSLKSIGCRFKHIKRLRKLPEPSKENIKREPCCGGGGNSPSMLKKAKDYAMTMARWVKAGRPLIDMKTFAERLSICAGCDSHEGYNCMECGCPMDIKAKMGIDNLCELNKW